MPSRVLHKLMLALAVAAFIHAFCDAANRCCQTVPQDPSCSGCVQVWESPDYYVNVGTNSISECTSTQQTSSCTEGNKICVTISNAQYFRDAGCINPIGTWMLVLSTPQCDDNDDACGGGG